MLPGEWRSHLLFRAVATDLYYRSRVRFHLSSTEPIPYPRVVFAASVERRSPVASAASRRYIAEHLSRHVWRTLLTGIGSVTARHKLVPELSNCNDWSTTWPFWQIKTTANRRVPHQELRKRKRPNPARARGCRVLRERRSHPQKSTRRGSSASSAWRSCLIGF